MSVTVNSSSRLRFAPLVTVETYEFWDLDEMPEIPTLSDEQRYQVKAGDRLDLLATRFYGAPQLKWVLAVANNIDLEPSELNEGQYLRVPSLSYVQSRLFQQARF